MEDPIHFSSPLLLTQLLSSISSDWLYLLTLIILMFVLIIFSALVSASEVAFFSLEPSDITQLKQQYPQKTKIIQALLNHPKRLLASILIANNALNISLVLLSTFFVNYFIQFGGNPQWYLIIQVVVITSILLLFGEITPKVLATARYKSISIITVKMIYFIDFSFQFFSKFLVSLSKRLDSLFKEENPTISVDELSKVHDMIQDYHHNEAESKMLKGILDLGNSDVRAVMQSRLQIIALNIEDDFDHVKQIIVENGYSRIPVFEENLDQIKGVLYIKDVLNHIDKGRGFNWKTLICPPFFVPENKKLDDVLRNFQDRKIHMAIVLDEYGGTLGLVTLEDVLEEIIGDIQTEFDEDELEFTILGEGTFVFDAKMLLRDICRIAEIDFMIFEEHKGEAESLAGFILEILGTFPKNKQLIKFKNLKFTIEALDKKSIKRVKLEVIPMLIEKNDKFTD